VSCNKQLKLNQGIEQMAKGKNFSAQHRVGKVREFLASGLTANEFCRQQGISNSTFSVWRKKLAPRKIAGRSTKSNKKPAAKVSATLDFVPVTIVEPSASKHCEPALQQLKGHSSLAMEMVLPSGGLIRLASNCPTSFLTAALAALAVR